MISSLVVPSDLLQRVFELCKSEIRGHPVLPSGEPPLLGWSVGEAGVIQHLAPQVVLAQPLAHWL